ncbi:hypothetical protein PLESTM_000554100 [Pleodorina starrii]|nr:hypothetical protein PLESTM_000554100 [Pleodorina starrii]
MLQQPLHPLPQPGSTSNLKPGGVISSSVAPALLRRLADPRHGVPAALAFLTLQATQRGPGWAQQTLQALLDWLSEPQVTALPHAPEPYTHAQAGPPQHGAGIGASHASKDGGDGGGGGDVSDPKGPRPHLLGLRLSPRALGFPQHLQPQLRQLLAAMPRCPKLYDRLDEQRRRLLQQLLAALPRGAAAAATTASGSGAARAATGVAAGTGRKATAGRGYGMGYGSDWRPGQAAAWVQAALQAARLRYERRPPPKPPQPPRLPQPQTQPGHVSTEAVAPPAPATAPQVDLRRRRECDGGGDGGGDDVYEGSPGGGSSGACGEDGGWWWIPEEEDPEIHALDPGSAKRDYLDSDSDAAMAPPPPPPPGHDADTGGIADAGEEGDEEGGATGNAAVDGLETEKTDGKDETAGGRASGDAVALPPAKRPRTVAAEGAPPPATKTAAAVEQAAAGPPQPPPTAVGAGAGAAGLATSMDELLRALQEAVNGGGDDGAGGAGGHAAAPETWRRLEALLERCAASGVSYTATAAGDTAAAAAAAAAPAALPADAVLLLVRQLVTPRLSGAAARLLLAAAVLPAVLAVERVMPRPLQEALTAAGGHHPRPLAESVLVPAVQRPQLSVGQAQLLAKAATAGSHPLPRPLQALVLRAAAAVGSEWVEAHVAVVSGLVEAAKEGLDQETLDLVCQGLCAAARAQEHQNQTPRQPPTARASSSSSPGCGVPLCRLLLSLLSRHGGALTAPQLRQLHEAAASTSTFLTKPCLTKLQELRGAGN